MMQRVRGLIMAGTEHLSDRTHIVKNPATAEAVGTYVSATAADVDEAVKAGVAAQKLWARTSLEERALVLVRAAELIERDANVISEVLTQEQGKPLPDSIKEVTFGAKVFRYYAENIGILATENRKTSDSGMTSKVRHAPLGVVAGIVPWNYPVDLWAWKVAPALAAGNAIMMKPPVEAPLAAGMTARLVSEAGIPPGLLADLPGGIETGEALTAHADVRGISATCSTAAGISIMRNAAGTMKRLILELGGNCPFIVLDDADIEQAAAAAVRRSFSNAGQICIAVNRIIVTPNIADAFVSRVAELADAIAVGNGLDSTVQMGPTTTLAVKAKTLDHVEEALQYGAKRVSMRSEVMDSGSSKSHFIPPIVMDRVDPQSRIASEETFGPAVGIIRVASTQEAIAVANASPYGLAAYVYTGDADRGESVAEQLEFGGVGVNVNDVTELDAPFGGWKMSGFGRDLGPEGLLGMTEPQHLRTRKN